MQTLNETRARARKWTVADIAAANEAGGFYFFSKDTMRCFGDTRKNFGVSHRDGEVYLRRLRNARNAPAGYNDVGAEWLFDVETGNLRKVTISTV
jgi:hypothetical protein